MLTHAPAILHAGLIVRSRPIIRRPAPVVTLVRPSAPRSPTRPAVPSAPRPRRHALTVRVEPDLRAALQAEKARLGTTAQAILHRALREHLGR